jgi:hypothetical protein
MEIGRDPAQTVGAPVKLQPQAIPMPAEAPNDFPVTMQASSKHDIVFMITKMGYLFMFDVHTARALYRARISTDTVFTACPQTSTGGVLGVTIRKGKVLQMQVNEETLVPYVMNTLRDNQLAIALASRMNLPGAEQLYVPERASERAGGRERGGRMFGQPPLQRDPPPPGTWPSSTASWASRTWRAPPRSRPPRPRASSATRRRSSASSRSPRSRGSRSRCSSTSRRCSRRAS